MSTQSPEPQGRIVITGVGVVSSVAIGREELAVRLGAGTSGERPFEFDGAEGRTACPVEPFDYRSILGDIKSRHLDRSTLLGLAATKLALADSQVREPEQASLGVVIGSAFGSLWSAGDYTRDVLTKGPMSSNPLKFPNTVMNSPASQINIRFGLKSLSSTITTGFTASLDALAYALNHLEMGYADLIAVGGIEELCPDALRGYALSGCLAGGGRALPFDRDSEGCLLGEGAAILILERETRARARGARILAEVGGCGTSFEPCPAGEVGRGHAGVRRAMQSALASAGMRAEDLDLISAAANGTSQMDRRELRAIRELAEPGGFRGRLTSIKGWLGECYGASGALQLAAAVGSIQGGGVPGVRTSAGSWEPTLDARIPAATVSQVVSSVMVNNVSPFGNSASAVVRKYVPARA